GGWTYYAWQHRGTASAIRGGAITLLPVSAYLTGTLKVVGRTADAVGDWAAGLVLSPVVWTGFALFGLSVLLFVVSGWLSSRDPTGRRPHGGRSRRLGSRTGLGPGGVDRLRALRALGAAVRGLGLAVLPRTGRLHRGSGAQAQEAEGPAAEGPAREATQQGEE